MNRVQEHRWAEQLSRLPAQALTAFSAACAETLWPQTETYFEQEDAKALLRRALDAVWDAATDPARQIDTPRALIEDLVPDEDEPGFGDAAALAQNGVASIAYAMATTPGQESGAYGGVQEAAWAARQVYDAADYAADQVDSPDEGSGIDMAEAWIAEYLLACEGPVTALRESAQRAARELATVLIA